MNRRDALARVAIIFGGTVVGAEMFLSGCSAKPNEQKSALTFTEDQLALLEAVSETILPTSAHSPGAKEAQVAAFMNVIVTDCYTESEQKSFLEGIKSVNDLATKKYQVGFVALTAEQKHELLVGLDDEAKQFGKAKKAGDSEHYFTMMKQLTLWGYFTSEVGSTKALRYNPLPGRYEGCIEYKKGDKAWAAI